MNVVEDYITRVHFDLGAPRNSYYSNLYKDFNDELLQEIFSTFHSRLLASLKRMNQRLPTGKDTAHFWADDSRVLLDLIEKITDFKKNLFNSNYSFQLDDAYNERIELFQTFLSHSGGSTIPCNTSKNEMYEIKPIFVKNNTIALDTDKRVELKSIGEGSYANVYKYLDENYETWFVKKKLKKNSRLDEKERFKREFNTLKSLNCPYIINVYKYSNHDNSYTMELMDYSLDEYFKYKNNKISYSDRKKIGLQVISAIEYIHRKELLHRDISLKNVLIKEYEDIIVAKLADFGLVKIPQSGLTSKNTELKGSLNDPELEAIGFNNYCLTHEIYALTRLLYFIITGKTRIPINKNDRFYLFVNNGINSNKDERYKTINELKENFVKYCQEHKPEITLVTLDLNNSGKEIGYIRADDVDNTELLQEISVLQEENLDLKNQLAQKTNIFLNADIAGLDDKFKIEVQFIGIATYSGPGEGYFLGEMDLIITWRQILKIIGHKFRASVNDESCNFTICSCFKKVYEDKLFDIPKELDNEIYKFKSDQSYDSWYIHIDLNCTIQIVSHLEALELINYQPQLNSWQLTEEGTKLLKIELAAPRLAL